MSKPKPKSFGREEFQDLRERSMHMEEVTPNPNWKAAYAAITLAVDHLDAMIARTEWKGGPGWKIGSDLPEPDDPADWWKNKEGD